MTRPPVPGRVLMTTDTVGGVWTYALELSRELCARGARVLLASMGGPPAEEQVAQVARIDGLELSESAFRLEWMDDPWHDVDEAGRWLLDLESRFVPDVVHLNGFAHGALPWRSPVLMVGHSCVTSWWRAVHGEAAPPAWDEYRRRVRRGLRGADLVVAPTAAMLASLDRHHGPLPRSRVILNGRDPSPFAPSGDEPFVLTVGRVWDEAKNVAVLARMAERLRWPVYVAGETRHPNGGDLPPRGCRILGRLDDAGVAHWMGRAGIYALPARYEPFGLSALEAALSGCALVLGDLPSLREVWGDAALYVRPDDPADVEVEMRRLIADPSLRRDLSRASTARALELSSSAMADAYGASYAELTRKKVAA